MRPHLEYAVQFWSPSLRKDIERLEAVQARAAKLIPSIRHLGYVRRLERLNLYSLEKPHVHESKTEDGKTKRKRQDEDEEGAEGRERPAEEYTSAMTSPMKKLKAFLEREREGEQGETKRERGREGREAVQER